MRMQEKLQVFLVTYNRADYLKESIASILKQTYSEFELVILDNCSTDHTEKIVSQFCDGRIKYVRHKENIGGIGNINYAIASASSKYFMIFHDDDVMKNTMLEQQINILEANSELAIVSCKADIIDADGKCTMEYKGDERLEVFGEGTFFGDYLSKHQFILFPAIMYRTDFMRENDLCLKEEVGPSADVYMCFEIEKCKGKIAILNQSLMEYRRHGEQDSSLNRVEMIVKLFRALRKDKYFGNLLKGKKNGQKKYYKWLMHNEICMMSKGFVSCDLARDAQKKYEKVMEFALIDHVFYKIVISEQKHLGLTRWLYNFCKKVKG